MSDGITETSIQELLDLSDADMRFIDLKIILKKAVKSYRLKAKLTQKALADLIDSSQSRVAKLEGGDSSVSTDMMLNCLFHLGVDNAELAAIVQPEIKKQTPASPAPLMLSDRSIFVGSVGLYEKWHAVDESSVKIFANEIHH